MKNQKPLSSKILAILLSVLPLTGCSQLKTLIETRPSEKMPAYHPVDRFARRVLGENASSDEKNKLRQKFDAFLGFSTAKFENGFVFHTDQPNDLHPGNSNAGHEFRNTPGKG
jgi:hypothetical protein